MTAKMPPVPPANRSPKGPGETATDRAADRGSAPEEPRKTKTGQSANTKVNTTHQGLQQDR
jgi:hypothetical protein